jgi:succinate dehydrogenase / fumarate reductase membrane anchor subunit
VFSIAKLATGPADFEALRWWVSAPSVAVTLVLFLAATLYHSMLGVQVVIEDYISHEGAKLAALVLSKFLHVIVGVSAIFAVLKVALG